METPSLLLIIILIGSGILVGFINAVSAGGTAISIALYLFLGLPPLVANATNRVGVLIQSFTASASFKFQGALDIKRTLKLALPTMIGGFVGALLATMIGGVFFKRSLAVVLIIMLFFLFYKPKRLKSGNNELMEKGFTWQQFAIFFLIGIYGGFIQVAAGFFFMIAGVMLVGFDIVHSNAMKSSLMFLYTCVALCVFWQDGLIRWDYGLLHASGNTIGAVLGSRLVVKKGANLVKWITVFIIVLTALQLLGVIQLSDFFQTIL